MQKFSKQQMYKCLDRAGEPYNYPLYVSVQNKGKFLSSASDIHSGYAALTVGGSILIADFNMMDIMTGSSEPDLIVLPLENVTSMKISKMPLVNIYKIRIKLTYNGKKYDYVISAADKVRCTDLDEQKQNLEGFMEALRQFA